MAKDEIKLFDWTTNFCGDKTDLRGHPSFAKTYDKFMINRVLSMSPKTCGLAMFMSQFRDIPNDQHFAFLNAEVDKEYIFFNYAKAEGEFPAKTIYAVREYWNCGFGRAIEYCRLMSEKQLETVLEVIKRRDAKAKKRKVKTKK